MSLLGFSLVVNLTIFNNIVYQLIVSNGKHWKNSVFLTWMKGTIKSMVGLHLFIFHLSNIEFSS